MIKKGSFPGKFANVGIVGGGLEEPELKLIKYDKALTLNRSEESDYDLSLDWECMAKVSAGKFDLIICCQVLEHVYDTRMAIKNLRYLLKDDGYLYLQTPGICNIHDAPDYFWSGFHPTTLELGCQGAGLKVITCGYWGSEKAAAMAGTRDWTPLGISQGKPYNTLHVFKQGVRIKTKLGRLKEIYESVKRYLNHERRFGGLQMWKQTREMAVISWIICKK